MAEQFEPVRAERGGRSARPHRDARGRRGGRHRSRHGCRGGRARLRPDRRRRRPGLPRGVRADDAANAAPAPSRPPRAAVPDEDEDLDPVEEFRRQLEALPGDWYVLHTYAGYEGRVKSNLEQRTASLNMEDYIFQIEVPTEEVVQVKGGKRQTVQQKKYPGYVYIRMDLTDESWSAVRNTPNVTGFVGLTNRPSPLRIEEVAGSSLRSREEAGRGAEGAGVSSRRVGHRHRRPVRHPAGDDQRGQPRRPAPEGAGVDLRSRDAGRAGVQPGRQDLERRDRARAHQYGQHPGASRRPFTAFRSSRGTCPRRRSSRPSSSCRSRPAPPPRRRPSVRRSVSTASTSWSSSSSTTRRRSPSAATSCRSRSRCSRTARSPSSPRRRRPPG